MKRHKGISFFTKSPDVFFNWEKKKKCITDGATQRDESFMCHFNYRGNMENKIISCIQCFV